MICLTLQTCLMNLGGLSSQKGSWGPQSSGSSGFRGQGTRHSSWGSVGSSTSGKQPGKVTYAQLDVHVRFCMGSCSG